MKTNCFYVVLMKTCCSNDVLMKTSFFIEIIIDVIYVYCNGFSKV